MELSDQYRDVFQTNYLVYGLPEDVIDKVAALGELVSYQANDMVIPKGGKGSDLFVILDGKVNIYSPGREKLGEAGPGSVLGEVALVDAGPRSADAVCVQITEVMRLPANDLRKFMADDKESGFIMLANLARVLSMRLRQTSVALEDLAAQKEDPWRLAT